MEAKQVAYQGDCISGLSAYVDDVVAYQLARQLIGPTDYEWRGGSALASVLGQQALLLPMLAPTGELVAKLGSRYEKICALTANMPHGLAVKAVLMSDWLQWVKLAPSAVVSMEALEREVAELINVAATLSLDEVPIRRLWCVVWNDFHYRLADMFFRAKVRPLAKFIAKEYDAIQATIDANSIAAAGETEKLDWSW